MGMLFGAQVGLYWLISLALLAMEVFALVDALRRRKDAFPATSNQTKQLWVGLLIGATAAGLLSLPNFLGPLNLLGLAAVVVSAIYLVKVRPAIISITGGRSSGPYGGY